MISNKSHLEPVVVTAVERQFHTSAHDDPGLKVIANLPYNISTPLIINLLETNFPLKLMVLTLQKDYYKSIVSETGNKGLWCVYL